MAMPGMVYACRCPPRCTEHTPSTSPSVRNVEGSEVEPKTKHVRRQDQKVPRPRCSIARKLQEALREPRKHQDVQSAKCSLSRPVAAMAPSMKWGCTTQESLKGTMGYAESWLKAVEPSIHESNLMSEVTLPSCSPRPAGTDFGASGSHTFV